MKELKKNIIYNVIYQILILIIPLITVPYISRVLGKDGVGIYSYTYSIVYYFMLITLLGINNHGNRSIAKVRNDKKELSKTFLSIYTIQIISGLIMIILYILYMLLVNKKYVLVSWIQIIYIFSAIFDINWFFFGLEEFKITISKNIVIKILTLVLILVLVNSKRDLPLYTLILSISTLTSQIVLLPILLKKVEFVKITKEDIRKHIKQILILFIPVIAVSVYRVMDKIMLGIYTNIGEVGLYEQADKIILVPVSIISAFGTVMLPRISNMLSNNKTDKILNYIEKSIEFIMFISIPMCLGLITISDNFVPLFLGIEFAKASILVKWMSITILFTSFANVLRTQYLIPYEKDKLFVLSITFGAIINLICNIIFIPIFASKGALIGTVFAEFFVMFIQAIGLYKVLPIKKYIIKQIPLFIKASIMMLSIHLVNYIKLSPKLILLIQILTGITIYTILNVKYIKKEILRG